MLTKATLLAITLVTFGSTLVSACQDTTSGAADVQQLVDVSGLTCPRADTYVAGLERETEQGLFSVVLRESTPAPPDKGNNIWLVEVLRDGAPLEGVTVTAEPIMSLHGHGTSPKTVAGSSDAKGQLTLEPLNFFMPGEWKTELHLEQGADSDRVVFRFCVEG